MTKLLLFFKKTHLKNILEEPVHNARDLHLEMQSARVLTHLLNRLSSNMQTPHSGSGYNGLITSGDGVPHAGQLVPTRKGGINTGEDKEERKVALRKKNILPIPKSKEVVQRRGIDFLVSLQEPLRRPQANESGEKKERRKKVRGHWT